MDLGFGGLQQGQTSVVNCPRAMVGRVIGKGGETIKALQQYTGASIQIDQSFEPTAVTISGQQSAVSLAQAMVQDIVNGSFKGFAMLRQMVLHASGEGGGEAAGPLPVYIEGYGFVPPTQFYNSDELAAAKMQGMAGFSAAVPRTPPSRAPVQRSFASPMAGLASTQQHSFEPALAGSPDISHFMSSLRLGEAGAAGALPMAMAASSPADYWPGEPQRPIDRGSSLPSSVGGLGGGLFLSGAAAGELPKVSSPPLLRRTSSGSGGGAGSLQGLSSLPGSLQTGGRLHSGGGSGAGLESPKGIGRFGESLSGGLSGLSGLSKDGSGSSGGRLGGLGRTAAGETLTGLAGSLSGLGTEGLATLASISEGLAAKMPATPATNGEGRAGLSSPLAPPSPEPRLPPGWTAVPDPDGRVFYFNSLTGHSQWDKPE